MAIFNVPSYDLDSLDSVNTVDFNVANCVIILTIVACFVISKMPCTQNGMPLIKYRESSMARQKINFMKNEQKITNRPQFLNQYIFSHYFRCDVCISSGNYNYKREIYCHQLIVQHKFCHLMEFAACVAYVLRVKGKERARESARAFVCLFHFGNWHCCWFVGQYAMCISKMTVWLLKIIDQFLISEHKARAFHRKANHHASINSCRHHWGCHRTKLRESVSVSPQSRIYFSYVCLCALRILLNY